MSEGERGWCQVGSSIWETTEAECTEVHGNWTKDKPGGICIVATAALGTSASEPTLADLRRLRDLLVELDPMAAWLANTYQTEYERVAAPIVELMRVDSVVRQIVTAIAVQPAAEFMRIAAVSSAAGNDDARVRTAVDQGVLRFRHNLMTLGGSGESPELFTGMVFDVLREVFSSPKSPGPPSK